MKIIDGEIDFSSVSDADLFRAAVRSRADNPQPIPKGFRSSAEWAALWGCSASMCKRAIRMLLKKGVMEMAMIRRPYLRGTALRVTPYYAKVTKARK